jgi:hypothetical protein
MSFENTPDDRLLCFYENIRKQVDADRPLKHKLTTGPTVRQYADRLRDEIVKRRLGHEPIHWPGPIDAQSSDHRRERS